MNIYIELRNNYLATAGKCLSNLPPPEAWIIAWHAFTRRGLPPPHHTLPASRVVMCEADAYARWAGARLPT